MKQFTTIFLLVIVFLQAFSSFVIQADYLLNKNYIARVLCVNKEKPGMHCNGKCYLARQMREQDKNDQQAPNPKKEKLEVLVFLPPRQFDFPGISIQFKSNYPYTEELLNSTFLKSVFHPPAVKHFRICS